MVLRSYTPDDAPGLAAAAAASLDHLAPWMPWATREGVTVEAMQTFITDTTARAADGSEAVYGLFDPTDGTCLGGCGLHDRLAEPGGIEVGYWLRVDATGRGLMTRVVGALCEVGLGLDGVTRIEVRCDATNARSAGVPRRLGFTLAGLEPRTPAAPADSDREMVWVLTSGAGAPPGRPPTRG